MYLQRNVLVMLGDYCRERSVCLCRCKRLALFCILLQLSEQGGAVRLTPVGSQMHPQLLLRLRHEERVGLGKRPGVHACVRIYFTLWLGVHTIVHYSGNGGCFVQWYIFEGIASSAPFAPGLGGTRWRWRASCATLEPPSSPKPGRSQSRSGGSQFHVSMRVLEWTVLSQCCVCVLASVFKSILWSNIIY